MLLMATFMFEPAKLHTNCASASGSSTPLAGDVTDRCGPSTTSCPCPLARPRYPAARAYAVAPIGRSTHRGF